MAEKNSDKKLEEANFEVSSLAEVKDENGNGIFHMKLKTKIILFVSILILLAAGALIYLFFEKYINAEIWQVAVWGICGGIAIYSIFAKSILSMLLNLILFAGLSFLPTWQSGYEFFRPTIERFTTEPAEKNISEPAQVEEKNSVSEDKKIPAEKISPSAEEKNSSPESKNLEEKIPAENKSDSENKLQEIPPRENSQSQENNFKQDLPTL